MGEDREGSTVVVAGFKRVVPLRARLDDAATKFLLGQKQTPVMHHCSEHMASTPSTIALTAMAYLGGRVPPVNATVPTLSQSVCLQSHTW